MCRFAMVNCDGLRLDSSSSVWAWPRCVSRSFPLFPCCGYFHSSFFIMIIDYICIDTIIKKKSESILLLFVYQNKKMCMCHYYYVCMSILGCSRASFCVNLKSLVII